MKNIFAIILFIWVVQGFAQTDLSVGSDHRMESFRLPDGPSGNSINTIVQGPNGFLWFGGHAGLYRYDGYRFKSYKSNPDNPDSLVFSYVEFLYWSSDEYLWIGTYGGGLFRFDPIDDSFIRYQHDPNDPSSLTNDQITYIVEQNDTTLWVGTTGGLNRLDRKTGRFERFIHDPEDPSSLSFDDVRSLFIDQNNTVWIGTGFIYNADITKGGLNRYNPDSKSFTKYLHNPEDATSLAGNIVRAIHEDSEGDFWIGSSGGLQKLDRNSGEFKSIANGLPGQKDLFTQINKDVGPSVVYEILEDDQKNLWVFTLHNGWDKPAGSIIKIDLTTEHLELLKNRETFVPWQVEQSQDGSFWIAGAGVGGAVNKIIPGNPVTKNIPFTGVENLSIEGLVNGRDSIVWGKSTSGKVVQIIGIQDNFKTYGVRPLPEIKIDMNNAI